MLRKERSGIAMDLSPGFKRLIVLMCLIHLVGILWMKGKERMGLN